ncbi:hypothetical protein TMatcc_001705 [Talaromyces marneffei ATCC 18224]|nr:uncharacterized protein EYB26_007091 [Talaromyces marneffei]KAE8551725.1 hypothetical protein EYB25_005615 [Talaromyces marneffei]QGA19402.1 hypothetical protein EYB26_007091 [Talaromyces marneffei]
MFQQDYPRRHSFGSSLPSSNYTEYDYICRRQTCHCEAANLEEIGPDDSISSRSLSSSQRRHAEYFHRPPILSIHREQLILNGSPYSFFAYNHDPNAEAEYCEQCQFCSASSKWCGRVSSNQVVKLPRSFLDDSPSDMGLYGSQYLNNPNNLNNLKVQLPNATWVQDPLIVNAAHISFANEHATPRDQQFQPAVFSHTLTGGPSTTNMDCNPSIDAVLFASQRNLSMSSLQQIRTIDQLPADGTECIKSYRDIRSTKEERLAIEEGSLVISISPNFTDLSQQLIAPDEFELRVGELFVVSRMYADMWALCVRIRNSECVAEAEVEDLKDSPNIKFIPLCAVTLASNFAAFTRRCAVYRDHHPYARFFPTGGHLITPPDRHESLEASRKYFSRYNRSHVPLPPIVFTLCKAPNRMPAGLDFEPREEDGMQEDNEAEAVIDNHTKNQHGTLKRFWMKFAPKESDSSAGQQSAEMQQNNTGLASDGKSIYPTQSRQEVPDHQDAAEEGNGNGNRISKRKSVRNFFSRSGRVKNGDTCVQV